jgi:hypothetical protein
VVEASGEPQASDDETDGVDRQASAAMAGTVATQTAFLEPALHDVLLALAS